MTGLSWLLHPLCLWLLAKRHPVCFLVHNIGHRVPLGTHPLSMEMAGEEGGRQAASYKTRLISLSWVNAAREFGSRRYQGRISPEQRGWLCWRSTRGLISVSCHLTEKRTVFSRGRDSQLFPSSDFFLKWSISISTAQQPHLNSHFKMSTSFSCS